MAETHVVHALMERRARLAGELRAKQAEVLHLRRALESVDLCIRMFKAGYEPALVAPKVTLSKNPAGPAKGAGYRAALEIMRETGQPFTATELAHLVLVRLGKEPSAYINDLARVGSYGKGRSGVLRRFIEVGRHWLANVFQSHVKWNTPSQLTTFCREKLLWIVFASIVRT